MLHVASSDGVRLAVHDLGGRGPDLLFAHATGFHGLVWAPLAAALAGRYHGWAIDYRGHGDSTAPRHGTFAWEGFGRDTAATVEALGLRRPAGVGHSMGGAALVLAELAHPGTFRALVLFEPIVFPASRERPEGGSPLPASARRRRSHFASRQEALANFSAKPPLNTLAPAALAAYVEHGFADEADGSVSLKCLGEHEARIYEMAAEHGAFDRLHEVSCPVLVLASRPEPWQPSTFAPDVAAALPAGRFECVPGVGHFGPLEDPARLARIVDTFLEEHPS